MATPPSAGLAPSPLLVTAPGLPTSSDLSQPTRIARSAPPGHRFWLSHGYAPPKMAKLVSG